eukprot:TRINITY_DN6240_c0_g1_i7.p2 TRINITY_DN6240_c0_g1~~TRINITY_DN6240_c0_g1_i7.p2  ORF type:complete len:124 (-),score=7.00 TRINITY_DN6240_c0_g1_i7:258-629(-)
MSRQQRDEMNRTYEKRRAKRERHYSAVQQQEACELADLLSRLNLCGSEQEECVSFIAQKLRSAGCEKDATNMSKGFEFHQSIDLEDLVALGWRGCLFGCRLEDQETSDLLVPQAYRVLGRTPL